MDFPIVGRTAEKEELTAAYQSQEAEFIAIYGRRRIGKTYLIKHFFQTMPCRYFQTTGIYKGTLEQQLTRFAKELGAAFYQDASMNVSTNWMEAFDALSRAIETATGKKIILFFDELPWMSTPKSGLLSALEYFWNRHWSSNPKIKLVVCGSSASWILRKIIKNKGGLHNRVTRKIRLKPFSLNETEQYLKHQGCHFDQARVAKLYMALGGIPFYLKQIKPQLSVDQNINELFFNRDSNLFDEFDEVFSSLFSSSESYIEIIRLIANRHDGLPRNALDVQNKLTGKGGRLTKRLEDMETAGFISTYLPFGVKKKGIFYRISDEYCHFYLRWVDPIKNRIKQELDLSYWQGLIHTAEYHNWLGYAFENLCFKHLSAIRKALKISADSLSSPWRYIPKTGAEENGAQIDLLFDRRDDAITLCEIKYTETAFIITKTYAELLKRKIAVFKKQTKTSKQIFLILISAHGLKQNAYSTELISAVVQLEQLFAG